MDSKQAFEIMKKHLLCQNERSVDVRGHCKFRGDNGLKCALGALIPDADYDTRMDGWGMTLPLDPGLDRNMLRDMRQLHDHHAPEHWPLRLKEIAQQYGYD